MSVFADISPFYDAVYANKDYVAEADYLVRLLRGRGAAPPASILELGCGTGRHALELSKMGYKILGVDQSQGMLEAARLRIGAGSDAIAFDQGDLRSYRTRRQFDAVLMCFHVINYQSSDADLRRAFATAAQHLRPGGVLIFDSWYGPAVVAQKPELRVKEFEDARWEIVRISTPEFFPERNIVVVNFRYFARQRGEQMWRDARETHVMRYLFTEEIERHCHDAGLVLEGQEAWLTGTLPGPDTWSVCYVARKSDRR